MANDGNSKDKRLLNKLRDKKIYSIKVNDSDDQHTKFIKHYMNRYLDSLWSYFDSRQYYTDMANSHIKAMKKSIIAINQYRQKHWYFNEIKLK